MHKNIAISIIVPVFNMEAHISECLKSICRQTLKNIEIVCIDDGSTDSSLQMLHNAAKTDDRIVVLTQPNQGVGKVRNRGIDAAQGEFISFMDPDDKYATDEILEQLYNKAIEYGVQVCGGELAEFKSDSDPIHPIKLPEKYGLHYYEKEGIIEYKDYQFDYGFQRYIYKTRFLKENDIYFPPYVRFQDPPFMVKALIKAVKFYGLKKLMYAYRVSHKQVGWNEKKTEDAFQGLKDVWDMACKYNLPKLKWFTVQHMADHFNRTKPYQQKKHQKLMYACDVAVFRKRKNLGRFLYSKQDNFLTKGLKLTTILGFDFISINEE